MIDKDSLEQLSSLHREKKDLRERFEKISNESLKTVVDSVKGSSKNYPYISHTCTIEGIEYPKRTKQKKKIKKLIEKNSEKLDKMITNLEYELGYIEDSDIRQIIRYKYEDNLNWIQIMHKMGYKSESAARTKLNRFFEKKL